ncbi:hypothetical protein [Enterococcus sp. DIV0187]|uniref:hypothetical protein n=1 Tax=Enterococcus sp. DIV0187 TaxID=2774644 RepID=UPI003F6837DA
MAKEEYQYFLSNKRVSVKKYLKADLIEKQCRILKKDVQERGFQYLTYYRNVNPFITNGKSKKKISNSTRLRNARRNTTDIYEFQKEKSEETDKYLIKVMENYYTLKNRNSKMIINEFLKMNNNISRRTFFNYKKIYDERYKGRSKFEKAREEYLSEIEKDPNFKITAEFVGKYKISQKQFKQYLDDNSAEA